MHEDKDDKDIGQARLVWITFLLGVFFGFLGFAWGLGAYWYWAINGLSKNAGAANTMTVVGFFFVGWLCMKACSIFAKED